jgi:hypothetical protein
MDGKMSDTPAPLPPNCQHCEKALPELGLFAYTVGGFAILNLFCPHCHKALHFQIFQSQQIPRVEIPS